MAEYPPEIKKALAERGITINHRSDNNDKGKIVLRRGMYLVG